MPVEFWRYGVEAGSLAGFGRCQDAAQSRKARNLANGRWVRGTARMRRPAGLESEIMECGTPSSLKGSEMVPPPGLGGLRVWAYLAVGIQNPWQRFKPERFLTLVCEELMVGGIGCLGWRGGKRMRQVGRKLVAVRPTRLLEAGTALLQGGMQLTAGALSLTLPRAPGGHNNTQRDPHGPGLEADR